MITSQDIKKANDGLAKIPLKGKKYAMVKDRVAAFRDICPAGLITTEIISNEGGTVTMRATVADEAGNVLATGLAHEIENASFINKTSYIEVCETSAVGRALAFLGIGVDESMASAEEIANSQLQQDALKSKISEKEKQVLIAMIEKRGLNVENVLNGLTWDKVTGEIYQDAINKLNKVKEISK